MKDQARMNQVMDVENIEVTQSYSAIISIIMVVKKEDSGVCTISCTTEVPNFKKALCNIWESLNFFQFFMFQKFGLCASRSITFKILLADCSIKKPMGVKCDVLVKVE